MFLRRQEIIDQFDANFREDEEGQVFFHPRNAEVGLPITWEEYAGTMAVFERVHRINQFITISTFLIVGVYGFHQVVFEDSYSPFFIGLVGAFMFTFALSLRDGLGLLLPFTERLEELKKSLDPQAGI